MKNNAFENDYARGWCENDVMYAEFKTPVMDLAAAKESVSARLNAAEGKDYVFLIDATRVNSITKEARDYLASDEGSQQIIASALVIDSKVGKLLGNFFLQINKPKIPLKLFTNKTDALDWLNIMNREKRS
ncbi:MAG: hypothetical protein EOP53_11575 [Sphingobacteriales bacterium]|nr:MAG: hypothetical protein EOP53_11575 [Sphingobacteriales bacterium]